MDYLWSPWRYQYVSGGTHRDGCIFCDMASDPAQDRNNLVLHRGDFNLIVLNRFPYTSGHVMVAPYQHVASLAGLGLEALAEMMALARALEAALRDAYGPDGYNLGMNLGRSAGAGIADHLHLHVLPRWNGDVNFMTSVGETRVLPEDLNTTYEKLVGFFRQAAPAQ
ncbi:MAG TPA: HIT domain-containing protein [Terriglobia bacterium]|jgi:ATP adenylyltransferase|nr:HIT domain-containing protein [Terriglobia bacterium]